jgi:ribonuclease HI
MNLCFMFRSQRIPRDDRLNAWEDDLYDERYSRFKRKPKSFGFLARKACEELELEIPVIRTFRAYDAPPWSLPRLRVCLELGSFSKAETSSEVFMQVFGEHQHVADVQIYTDGSKMEGKVGSGVYIQGGGLDAEVSESLGKFASVFTAELVAIRVALVRLRLSNNLKVVLYSDSRSALQALLVYNSENVLVQDVQELVFELFQREVEVLFCWVPSHVGIKGNEKADELAKAALDRERQGQASVFFSDWKGHVRDRLYHKWRERWTDMVDDRWTQLRGVQDFIRPRKWGVGLTRMEDIKITRLRIGHTRFARDFYFTGNEQPECIECGEVLTVEHVLLDCGNFFHERREHLGDGELSLSSLLGAPEMFGKVLEFFRVIGLYNRI